MTRVAIQGIEGSYSSAAARELVGDDAALVECRDFEETFAAVRMGRADCAVVPVANRIVGEIRRTAVLLEDSGLSVSDKLDLRVEHLIVGTPASSFANLVSVRSHIEALKQCRRFLDKHSQLERVIGSDTASSIRRIVEDGDPSRGAIGSRQAADLYGAKVLREQIADDSDNWTTFYLVGS